MAICLIARGIDRIERTPAVGSTLTGYPVYDAHGNMVATLFKSGSSFTLGDQRSYDAWGVIRSGNTTGEPNARYCANLGHLADDESSLTYMRARYYEASSGRFVSEDPATHGWNWYCYAKNRPLNLSDPTGLFAIVALDPGFGETGEAAEAGEAINALAQMGGKLEELEALNNEVLSLLIEADEIGNEGVLEAIGQLGRDPKLWRKAYMMFEHVSGETIKVHSFAEIVDGVVTAVANGETCLWWEWI